jgi:4-hydroxy-3-polyprenylbenzoate decarboxylase
MSYRSLMECCQDLERSGRLVRVREEVDPDLEAAEVQRRVFEANGPALFFERLRGSRFPAVSNLFGTEDRWRFIFRKTFDRVRRIVEMKADPSTAWRSPMAALGLPWTALTSLPWRSPFRAPSLDVSTTLDALPRIRSWPEDGGPFITLPQVLTEDPDRPGVLRSNVGMYRIQLAGNDYTPNSEVGLHYQIHRGIGIHHAAALRRGEALRVSVFVGGPPAHTVAAVMPLPEGLSELFFAGMLAGRRFRYRRKGGYVISSDADFVITGTIDPKATKLEGPFGDHLGYYSLAHDFPILRIDGVYHRKDAVWPFTVVGRPPQEDTSFGKLIHELTLPMVPKEIPGVRALHAVDAAGVHPLLLAIGSERYVPWVERCPQEILTIANAILGFGQCSLAKYLWIAAEEDEPGLDIHDVGRFIEHVLERVDLARDLHFQTRTTIDTLDYSGTGLNAGSKLVIAAAGTKRRELARTLSSALELPSGYGKPALALPGVLVIEAPPFDEATSATREIELFAGWLENRADLRGIPLIVLADDADFTARNLTNLLWVTFTRSNPSHDVHGVGAFTDHKHWGCRVAMIIDARLKPHHAPPLVADPDVARRVDAMATPGKSLHGII